MKDRILSHKKAIIAVCIFAVLVMSLIIIIQRKNSEDRKAANELIPVNYSQEIVVWGEVLYSRIESINIDFPATVTDVQVKEGERVTLGQPLVTIDLSEYNGNMEKLKQQLFANQSALDSAAQDISALQADISQLQNEIVRKDDEYISSTNADLKLLQNSLSLALKELEDSKNDFQDYQHLYDEGVISEMTFNQYVNMLDQRQKAVDDVEANIQKTKTALKDELNLLNVSLKSKQVQLSQLKESNKTNVAMQQSGVSAAQVDLDIMIGKIEREYIIDSCIVSNIENGIVKNITVNSGSNIGSQGMPTEVIQIIDADSITISAEVYEEFIESVKVGDTVRIVPTSSPDTSLEGTVTHIPDLAMEKDGRRVIRVIVKPVDTNNILKPGFTADVYFPK
ncbi:MAG TPA: secretion protein HlyD [Clostridiales bacterium]|nr:efflux RND transporter periplasmic adaptor subunit [Tissierellia bacterium]HBC30182.1 secretion protein HlyD [Clostridiales bacterium]HCS11791.1 secretion protein HlyD [Clostridiales bacterium]